MASPSLSPSLSLSPSPSLSPSQRQPRPIPRCVYVTCFGSHPCGNTIVYEGRGSWRLQRHEVGRGPREAEAAMAAAGPPGNLELASPKTGRPPASSPETPAPRARQPLRQPGQARGSRRGRAPRAGPGNISDAYEFYMSLNEAAKITKKKKKHAVWESVYKVISKMLNENEKIRDRMNFKQGCAENGHLAQSIEEESSHFCGRNSSS